jgi:phospholipid transport system transporter-binding protein
MATDTAFSLTGQLTMEQVPGVYKDHRSAISRGQFPDRIDLSGVERSDSSALALLLDWQAKAAARGRRIEFSNPPESLMVLASLTQASELLGWSPPSTEN